MPFIVVAQMPSLSANQRAGQDNVGLKSHTNPTLASIEQAINQAILSKSWQQLNQLLTAYRQQAGYDLTLWRYAKGAWFHSQKHYKAAIRLYREMLADNPDLLYPRFDLAVMLFQDKQYVAAKSQFLRVQAANGSQTLHQLSEQYLLAIDQAESWQFSTTFNYSVDNNVNNASANKTIQIGNATFVKTADSLPQKAHGINYTLSAERDKNLFGAHYLNVGASLSGEYYWDASQYDTTRVRLSGGYRYKSAKQTWSLKPFVEGFWLGGNHYRNNVGLGINSSYRLNNRLQVGGNITVASLHYMDKGYRRFNSKSLTIGTQAVYFPSAKQYFLLGTELTNDNAKDHSESHRTNRLRLGWGYEWQYGISSRINYSVAHKRHKAPHYLFGYHRRDITHQAELTLWKRDWHLWGLTPKLTYQWLAVHSNIDDLYSRQKQQVFLNIEKSF